jgi:hypothetical protein
LIHFGSDTINTGFGEFDVSTMCAEMGRAFGRAFEPPPGDHHWDRTFLIEGDGVSDAQENDKGK